MTDLTGKKVLITGGSQGIGLALAQALAEAGAKVYINGSNAEKATSAAAGIAGAEAAVYDLAKADCADALYAITGAVDILILNASVQFRTPWHSIPDEEFDRQVSINLRANLKLIQKYAPYMQQKRWGRIITVGSVQQTKPHKDMLIYAATKSALENMVRNLAKQLAPDGITVNNIVPGVIETPRNEKALSDESYAKQVLSGIPCGYAAQADACVPAVLMLCSEESHYITGANIDIDGGMKL